MLLTVEKVAILSSIPMFKDIPGYVLASVAEIMEEVELEAGETFIKEDAIEDCLYIVVDGRVRVHSQGQDIAIIEAGQIVGELAVLDPEPRSASVTTLEDTFLLRLTKEPFDEVMADRPEIAAGVVRTLCQRIRNQVHYMMAAKGV
ncbi:MAG: cyclic nucleotide-binding domain-containing protein [Anaerolineae bacterium]|nr:cyclic nucleotide-binding domain-containing protein [Anaerolineae bacterium]